MTTLSILPSVDKDEMPQAMGWGEAVAGKGGWEVLCSLLAGAARARWALTVSPQRERHLGPRATAPVPEPERAVPEEEQHHEPG